MGDLVNVSVELYKQQSVGDAKDAVKTFSLAGMHSSRNISIRDANQREMKAKRFAGAKPLVPTAHIPHLEKNDVVERTVHGLSMYISEKIGVVERRHPCRKVGRDSQDQSFSMSFDSCDRLTNMLPKSRKLLQDIGENSRRSTHHVVILCNVSFRAIHSSPFYRK